MNTPVHPSRRFLVAYWVTGRVVLSYALLWAIRPLLTRSQQDRITRSKHIRNAKRLGRAIERLQGLYIKVGQLFSIMANFLPPEFRQQLESLQDAVPARDFSEIRARLKEEFGKEPDEVFQKIDPVPIASASLGQVHRATLPDGTEVAVKVRYPGIEDIVDADLVVLRKIVDLLDRMFPTHGLLTVYKEIEQMVVEELDFHTEAESLKRISGNFSDREGIHFPVLYPEYCTQTVLTSGYVDGEKITAAKRLPREERKAIAEKIVHAYCQQIFEDGEYHADPHPGNLRLRSDGEIVLLDFGATAELSENMREGIVQLLQAVLSKNTERIQQALGRMGFLNRSASPDVIEQIIGVLHERLQSYLHVESMNLKEMQVDPQVLFDTLTELRRMNVGVREVGHYFHIPKEWILLERTLLLLTGLCTELDEELQPMELLKPYLERMLSQQDSDWTNLAIQTVQEVGLQYLSLPTDIKKIIRRANMGRLEIRTPAVTFAADRIYAASRQLMWTGFTIASGVLSALFFLNGEKELAEWLFVGSCSFGGLLVLSIVRDFFRTRRR